MADEEKELDPGRILDILAFKSMSPKQIAQQVATKVKTLPSYYWPRPVETRVTHQVDQLAERYGNLGVSRRKMVNMVLRLIRRRDRKVRERERRRLLQDGNQDP